MSYVPECVVQKSVDLVNKSDANAKSFYLKNFISKGIIGAKSVHPLLNYKTILYYLL